MSVEWSCAKSEGRIEGAPAPEARVLAAISWSSVETITRLIKGEPSACSMEYTINGFPPTLRIFFRGIDLDPPRAGINARTSFRPLITFFLCKQNETHLLRY